MIFNFEFLQYFQQTSKWQDSIVKPSQSSVWKTLRLYDFLGTVSYNLTGWLEKNKDPLNDSVVDQMKNGTNKLVPFSTSYEIIQML